MISYWSVVPHMKKGKKLKLTDIMEIPLLDGDNKTSDQMGKVFKLTPEEIEQFHAGTWEPPEDIKDDNSAAA